MIELSDDGGTLWVDVTSVPGVAVSNGYTQSLAASPSKNPLAGRRAFGGPSAGYPTDWVTTKIEIGKILAGKSVKLRFRTGSDDTVGAPGWDNGRDCHHWPRQQAVWFAGSAPWRLRDQASVDVSKLHRPTSLRFRFLASRFSSSPLRPAQLAQSSGAGNSSTVRASCCRPPTLQNPTFIAPAVRCPDPA